MSINVPCYCEFCKIADTQVIWNPLKKENCIKCNREMIRASPDTYGVVFGWCDGCGQNEQGITPLELELDENNHVIGSHCPNCHKIGSMRNAPNELR